MKELYKVLEDISNLHEKSTEIDKINELHKHYKKIVESISPENVLLTRLTFAFDQYKSAISG